MFTFHFARGFVPTVPFTKRAATPQKSASFVKHSYAKESGSRTDFRFSWKQYFSEAERQPRCERSNSIDCSPGFTNASICAAYGNGALKQIPGACRRRKRRCYAKVVSIGSVWAYKVGMTNCYEC